MFRYICKSGALGVCGLCVFSTLAFASVPQKIEQSGNWAAYTLAEGEGKICYMASEPVDAKGNYSSRGKIYALITHKPSENSKNVFSYIAGYTYKKDSKVEVTVDGKKFSLFTQDDTAWAHTSEDDQGLSDAIKNGSKLIIKGVSSKGTETTDVFSLKGATAAYKSITQECYK